VAVALAAFVSVISAAGLGGSAAGPASQPAAGPAVGVFPAGSRGVALDAYAASGHHIHPRWIARKMARRHFQWYRRQWKALDRLWEVESSWNRFAYNPYTGAYGIPQAVPGSKMSSAGPHWRTRASTQIRWGLRYIRARYGSPRRAWAHEQSYGWY
jgi:hypothetical protein